MPCTRSVVWCVFSLNFLWTVVLSEGALSAGTRVSLGLSARAGVKPPITLCVWAASSWRHQDVCTWVWSLANIQSRGTQEPGEWACRSQGDSRSSALAGPGFAQENCWGHWAWGIFWDSFVHECLHLRVRQLRRTRIQGNPDKVIIVHVVHTHCTYIHLHFLLTNLYSN